jgi:hypothetical protein
MVYFDELDVAVFGRAGTALSPSVPSSFELPASSASTRAPASKNEKQEAYKTEE